MAKEKSDTTGSNIEELFKNGLLRKGTDLSLRVERISTGIPSLDSLLGGGIPTGRCMQIFGPESTGKNLIAQYMTAGVQKTDRPLGLFLDLERSYDEEWWKKSGVDTDKLLVSMPTTGEQAIDIIRIMLRQSEELGFIFLDSIAAMIPQALMDPDKSSEDSRQPGDQAKVVTRLYQQMIPLMSNNIAFLASNQMRDNIGGYSETAALPGGRAARHYSHITLKTRRESWIKDSNKRVIGYYLELTSIKNKTCSVPDGSHIMLPILAESQLDMLTAFLESAIVKGTITKRGPYYRWNDKNFMGMENLRNHFRDNEEEYYELEKSVQTQE